MLIYVTSNGTKCLVCGKTLSSFRILSSLSTINTDLMNLRLETCWDLIPHQSSGWSGFCSDILNTPQKSSGSFSERLWIIRLIILLFSFRFLKDRVSLGKLFTSLMWNVSPHSKYPCLKASTEDFTGLYSDFLVLAIYARREFWSSCSRLMIGCPCPSWNAMIAYEKCRK